jgi:MFS transporter, DHA1 family, multidrug resistance protein
VLIGQGRFAHIGGLMAQPWWRALAVLWIVQVVAEIAFSFALPFIPLYIQELGVTDVTQAALWAGAMAGGFAVAMAAMGPVWGMVADRFGSRLMVQRALFGACLVVGLMTFVQTPQQLLVLRIIQGSLTGVVAATSTMVSLLVPRRHLGSTLGLMHAALFAGASIGPILGGVFSDALGYRAAFAATALIFLVSGVLVTLFVPNLARPKDAADGAEAPDEAPAPGVHGKLIRREVLAVVFLMAIIRFANYAPQPVLPLFVQQFGEEQARLATTVGIVVAASGIASTISAITVGRLADRYGRQATLLVCLIAAAVLSPLHAAATSVWQLLVLRTAMGFALGGMVPALQAALTDLTPAARRGAAFGLMATASALGNGMGPVVGSAVAAAFGFPAVFIAVGPVFLTSAAMLVRLPVPGRRPAERSTGSESESAEPPSKIPEMR